MAGLLPNGSTPPATLYPTVQVNPGTNTIKNAVTANGGNHTYLLANGTYIENNISVPNHVQFIGAGASSVTVRASSSGNSVFKGGGGADFVTIWGVTIDLAGGNGNALGDNFSDLLLQNVHVQNYASTALGFEDFPVYLFATGYSPHTQTIDSCQFTQAASGSVDGTSVIATGAFRPDGSNYTNLTISNNLFDTPTDHGSLYYHCVGSAQTCSGNVFVCPNFSNGQFWYEEAGSWNGNPAFQTNASNTSTLTGNTVTLTPNWDFAGVVAHSNGNNENLVITGNTIHGNSASGAVVGVHPGTCPSSGFAITSLILQNNAIDTGVRLVNQGCTNGSPWTTSPNNGITAVPSLTASAPNPISNTSATLIGSVSSNNGSNITTEGFDWGTTTSYGNSPNVGTIVQSGNYSLQLNNLTQGQQYHYRARAVNSTGTGFSSDVGFIPSTPSPNGTVVNYPSVLTITDAVGNVWAITSGQQVSLNGSTAATSYTSGVMELAYVNSVVWQYNGTSWYSFKSDGSIASGPTTTSPITPFVQGAANTSASASSITVSFPSQTQGNANIIAISYHSITVGMASNPVVDTKGNPYSVLSPLTKSDSDSQVIYYCPSIAGTTTANAVTITFASTVTFIAIKAAEYHGLGSIDAHKENSSTTAGTVTSIPAMTTTNAGDIVIVCVCCGNGLNGVVPGFTERVSGTPYGSDLQDDSPGVVLSGFTAPSPIISSTWVENVVAFLPQGTASQHAGDDRFGFATHFGASTPWPLTLIPNIAATGVGWIRDDVSWHAMYVAGGSVPGVYAIDAKDDAWIKSANLNGLNVIAIAGANSAFSNNYDPVQMPIWAAWFAKQYQGFVGAIEVVNEPNNIAQFQGAVGSAGNNSYITLVNAVYQAVLATGTGVDVIGCDFQGSTIIGMLPNCTMDGVVYHPYDASSNTALAYPESTYEPSYLTYAPWIKALTSSTSLPKWETEWGISNQASPAFSQDNQACYLVRRLLMATAFNVDHTIIYEYADNAGETFGVVTSSSPPTPKLSYGSVFNTFSTLKGLSGSPSQSTTSLVTVVSVANGNTADVYAYSYTSPTKTVVSSWFGNHAIVSPPAASTCTIKFTVASAYSGATVFDPIANTSVPLSTYGTSTTGNVLTVSGLPISDHPTLIILPLTGGVTAVPILIQHASSGSNSNAPDAGVGTGNPGNPFHFNLPNPSLSGNTLILEATGRVSATPTITDNFTGTGTPNTWTFVKSSTDGAAQTSVFVALNATAGTQRLVITFSGNIYNAHFCCSEFNNITSVVGSSSVHNTGTATISAGTLSGGIQGDLVWMCGYDTQNSNGLSANITNIASGAGMTLLSVDQFVGDFCQFGLQPTSSQMAPTATLSGSTDAFNAVVVVLRAGTAGTGVPSGIRVMRVQAVTAQRAIAIQFPSGGNLIYVETAFGNNIAPLSFPSGWSTKLSVGGGQGSYLSNASSSPNFSVLIGGTTTGIGNCTMFLYDIVGAASSPFDVTTNGLTTITGGKTNMVFGTISPTTANGVCIITVPVFYGVVTAASNAPTCMYDMSWYGNEAYDPDLMSNADGYAHIYNASAGPIQFTWTFLESSTSIVDTLQYLAVAFKAATPPVQTNFYVTPTGAGNGSTWAAAGNLFSIANAATAGNTIWMAGGTYSVTASFTSSGTSGNPITIKRATAASGSVVTGVSGWNSGTMDVQVVFSSGLTFSGSYWVFDGNEWTPPGLPSQYGIRVNLPGSPNSGTTNRGVDMRNGHATLRNVEIAGPGFTATVYETDGIEFGSNALISGCKIHDMDTAIHNYGPGLTSSTIEYTTIYNIGSTDSTTNIGTGPHPDVWYNGDGFTNCVFRYNVVANVISEGCFIDFQHNFAGGGMVYYGNLMFQGTSQGGGCVPIEYTNSNSPTFGSVYVYNNTFVDWSKGNNRSGGVATLGSGSTFQNNLFVNASNEWVTGGTVVGTMSYNGFSPAGLSTGTNASTNASSPFVSSSSAPHAWVTGGTVAPNTIVVADGTPAPVGYDPTPYIPAFSLAASSWAINKGNISGLPTTIGGNAVTLNTDMFGNTGSSLGAFQTSGTVDTTPSNAPTGLSSPSKTSSTVQLSWTASTTSNTTYPASTLIYLLEHMGGAFPSFTQFGTTSPGVTTATDSGLSANTSYSYRVRAQDPSGVPSAYSSTLVVVTTSSDTTPPTVPSGMTVTLPTSNSLTIKWNESTDVITPTASIVYSLQRQLGSGSFTVINASIPGTGTGTVTFIDSGLSPSSTYGYEVSARDQASNQSAFSTPSVTGSTTVASVIPAFVQASEGDSLSTSVSVQTATFASAQIAGHSNIIVIGWNNPTPGTVSSVVDSSGNVYVPINTITSA